MSTSPVNGDRKKDYNLISISMGGQLVAVCCSVLQCVAVFRVAVCRSVSQCVAVCCSVLQCVAVCCSVLQCVTVCCSVLQCVAVCCSALQCVAVCCSVLQCAAVCLQQDDFKERAVALTCNTFGSHMSHFWMSHVTYTNQSSHTYE